MKLGGLESTPQGLLDHAFGKLAKRGRAWLWENLFQGHVAKGGPELQVREILNTELQRFAHIADADFRIKALKTTQWAFRWTLPSLRAYQLGAFPRLPFLDPRMLDFFCTVPTRLVRSRRLQIEYLKRFAPDLARIRWQAYDTNLFRVRHFHTWLTPVRVAKKLWRVVRRRPVIQRNWEVQFFAPGQWKRLQDWLLRPGLAL